MFIAMPSWSSNHVSEFMSYPEIAMMIAWESEMIFRIMLLLHAAVLIMQQNAGHVHKSKRQRETLIQELANYIVTN
jgi:hypothetical protein